MYPNDNDYRPEGMDSPVTPESPSGYTEPTFGGYTDGGYRGGEWHGSPYASTASGSADPGVPPTPEQPQSRQKKPKKGWTAGKVVALGLACALVGGGVSGGTVAYVTSRNNTAVTASAEPTCTTVSSVLESDRSATTTVQHTAVQAGQTMTPAEIYAAYSNSVACIEVSTSYGTGAGTGFVITADGYLVTCYHVIDGATDIAVTFPDGSSYEATLVGGDEDNDIAVLKIDASGLTPVVLGDSSLLQVGDSVTAIGNALGTLSNTTTTGIVSALDRAITMSDGTVINVLQTDCTINSGNSGGPLFNQYGEVIGIVNAKYSSSGYGSEATIEGIGFAIPYADITGKISDLMQYGYITGKPYLGITVSTVTPLDAQRYNMVVGAYVNSVAEGSCAETAGLQTGDIITAVDGEEITTYEELVNAKNSRSAGDTMTLTIYRDGEELTLTVVLDEQVPTSNQSTDADNSQARNDQSGQNGQGGSYYGFDSPEEFFNYFFGGNGQSGSSRGNGGW